MWRKTTTDAFVLSVIDKGYRIQWNPKLGPPPPSEQLNSKNCENYKDLSRNQSKRRYPWVWLEK